MTEETKPINDETAVKVVNDVAAKEENGSNKKSRSLSRDLFFKIMETYKPKLERVEVPEWEAHLWVRELTGKQRDKFELSQLEGKTGNQRVNLQNMRAKLVAATACDAEGHLLFGEGDVYRLGDASAKAITRIYKIAAELAGITQEDEEELTVALGEDQKDASGSS